MICLLQHLQPTLLPHFEVGSQYILSAHAHLTLAVDFNVLYETPGHRFDLIQVLFHFDLDLSIQFHRDVIGVVGHKL